MIYRRFTSSDHTTCIIWRSPKGFTKEEKKNTFYYENTEIGWQQSKGHTVQKV